LRVKSGISIKGDPIVSVEGKRKIILKSSEPPREGELGVINLLIVF
jgi:hypothetical protein